MSVFKYIMWATGWLLCIGGVGTMDVSPNASIFTEAIVIAVGMAMLVIGCLIDMNELERRKHGKCSEKGNL